MRWERQARGEMGKVMARIIPQVEGRADLKKVSQTVAALLRERS